MSVQGKERSYGFASALAASQSAAVEDMMRTLLRRTITGVTAAYPASEQDDRRGVDWWVERDRGRRVRIDLKIRSTDWLRRGRDDLALERWSNVERQVPGWTLRQESLTDLVLWYWQDTGRWCYVPFRPLVRAFAQHLEAWERYARPRQHTPEGDYHSQAWMVPRLLVEGAVDDAMTPAELGEVLDVAGPQLPPYWSANEALRSTCRDRRFLLLERRAKDTCVREHTGAWEQRVLLSGRRRWWCLICACWRA